ncbi:MAG: hypothetical protein OXJ90_13720 [Spirochaetaceae bacterium]|nr:hypothetical protein [Spirochaetaceae bacterium]
MDHLRAHLPRTQMTNRPQMAPGSGKTHPTLRVRSDTLAGSQRESCRIVLRELSAVSISGVPRMLACRTARLEAKATIGLLSSLLEKNVHGELSALQSGKAVGNFLWR